MTTAIDWSSLAAEYNAGTSARRIARRLGLHEQTVRRHISAHGAVIRQPAQAASDAARSRERLTPTIAECPVCHASVPRGSAYDFLHVYGHRCPAHDEPCPGVGRAVGESCGCGVSRCQ